MAFADPYDALLRYQGERFLQQAYQAVLEREPDADGIGVYRGLLEAPGGRSWVLANLLWSEEGRRVDARVPGIDWIRSWRWLPAKRLLRAWLRRQERRRCQRPNVAAAMQVQTLIEQLGDVLPRLQEMLSHAISSTQGSLEQTQGSLEQTQGSLEQTQGSLEQTRDSVARTRESLATLNAALAEVPREQRRLAQQIDALRGASDQQRNDIERNAAHAQSLHARDEELVQWLHGLQGRLDGSDARANEIKAQVDRTTGQTEGNLAQIGAQLSEVREQGRVHGERLLNLEREADRVRGFVEFLGDRMGDPSDGIEQRIDRVATDARHAQSELQDKLARLSRDFDFSRADLIYHRSRVQTLTERLAGILGEPSVHAMPAAGDPKPAREGGALQQVAAEHVSDALDGFYVAFEDAFRGDRAQIRDSLVHYLADIKRAGTVTASRPLLDIGCGRGEWLELLREHRIAARGLDLNRVAVEQCRELGLDVAQGDALALLRAQAEGTLGAVSLFHLVEHLPLGTLFELMQHIYRVLVPGGVVLLETPNPENLLVGSHTFYHDPTHRNPLTPTSSAFFLRYCGFSDPEIRRLHPYPETARVPGNDALTERVNGHLCGPQDFALIAQRPVTR